jgi:outer membrane transport energization protein TonB (TC 2.C.1.1.1)
MTENGKVKDVEGLVTSQQIVSPANLVDTTLVYDVVDEMPEFNGGIKDIAEFLTRVVKYPEYEEQMGVQGRVVVSFIVERDGSVSTPSVISPVSPGLDRESVNAVMSMPKWKPGKHNGVSVRTRMNVPVSFRLNKDN